MDVVKFLFEEISFVLMVVFTSFVEGFGFGMGYKIGENLIQCILVKIKKFKRHAFIVKNRTGGVWEVIFV